MLSQRGVCVGACGLLSVQTVIFPLAWQNEWSNGVQLLLIETGLVGDQKRENNFGALVNEKCEVGETGRHR